MIACFDCIVLMVHQVSCADTSVDLTQNLSQVAIFLLFAVCQITRALLQIQAD